jgi:hypothetical protein
MLFGVQFPVVSRQAISSAAFPPDVPGKASLIPFSIHDGILWISMCKTAKYFALPLVYL